MPFIGLMVWCHQATSHCMHQYSHLKSDTTRPDWATRYTSYLINLKFSNSLCVPPSNTKLVVYTYLLVIHNGIDSVACIYDIFMSSFKWHTLTKCWWGGVWPGRYVGWGDIVILSCFVWNVYFNCVFLDRLLLCDMLVSTTPKFPCLVNLCM